MKVCSTCQEQFADRFSFCPVDGSPLTVVPQNTITRPTAPDIESSYPVAESAAYRRSASEPVYTAPPAAPIVTPPVSPSVRPPVTAPVTPPLTQSSSRPTPEPARVTGASLPTPTTPNLGRGRTAAAPAMIGEYHLTILEDVRLLSRLARELGGVADEYRLTWPEFKRDPFGFVARSIRGYGQMIGRFLGSRDVVLAMVISVVAMGTLVGIIAFLDKTQSSVATRGGMVLAAALGFCALIGIFATWLGRDRGAAVMGARPSDSRNVLSGIIASFVIIFGVIGVVFVMDRRHASAASTMSDEDFEITQMLTTDVPNSQPTPDEGTAGMAKGNGGGSKPKQEKAGGGGGGGREEQTPASFGKLPQADLRIPQVVAPDPHPPVIKNPALPMPATLDADPALFPPDTRQLAYGDPKSKSTVASSGPGTGNGIGNGTGGGVGPGEGGGYGPGRGGNTGGGDRHEGGGGPGGGGGGTDYNRVFNAKDVTQRAKVLSKPEPTYTEEARKNQITGTVILKAVFSSGGQVTNIAAVSHLPDGLTERAIAAARQIRFVPAMKDGHPVSTYVQLEYNFNLY